MQLYLFVCCFPRDTRLKSFGLHLYTFIQFQIRFKTHLNDLTPLSVMSMCFLRLSARVSHLSSASMDWILQYLVTPETIRAASFCTDSMSDFCWFVQLSQRMSPYSKSGRIKDIYIFSRQGRLKWCFKDLRRPMRFQALPKINEIWCVHLAYTTMFIELMIIMMLTMTIPMVRLTNNFQTNELRLFTDLPL